MHYCVVELYLLQKSSVGVESDQKAAVNVGETVDESLVAVTV